MSSSKWLSSFVLLFSLAVFAKDNLNLPQQPLADNSAPTTSSELRDQLYSQAKVGHHSVGYDVARQKIFGLMYLEDLGGNEYGVTDVYCQKLYTDDDFKGDNTFGPGLKPENGNVINTEHTWPQAHFGGVDRDKQKADLHHLFPADSKMNSIRGSMPFGDVVNDDSVPKCDGNKRGPNSSGRQVYEPPAAHKGNVARALFYFAVRYKLSIDADEEEALRRWNKEDPVDAKDIERNNAIEYIQGNRNPFIDHPEYVDQIENF